MTIYHPAHEPELGICVRGEIGRTKDGDTLVFLIAGALPADVRLLGCWAHETSDKRDPIRRAAEASAAYLESLAPQGRLGKLFIPTEEARNLADVFSFSRGLGAVWLNGMGMSVSQAMVVAGHAFTSKAEQDADAERLMGQ